MQYIYSRVSTDGQDNGNQLHKLCELYPDAQVIEETASGAKVRPLLARLVSELSPGDTLIVAALDRLGRGTIDILSLIESLERRGIILKSIREGIDYSTLTGRLVTQILVSVAEMERGLIAERTRLALVARKQAGVRLGRPPKFDQAMADQVRVLHAQGMTYRAIQSKTGVSKALCHRWCHQK